MIPIPPCPNCGAPMFVTQKALLTPDTPPWHCRNCLRAFWEASLTAHAREHYRPEHHDWGFQSEGTSIREWIHAEAQEAWKRGTSLRVGHLDHLPLEHLQVAMDHGPHYHPAFLAELDQHVASRRENGAE